MHCAVSKCLIPSWLYCPDPKWNRCCTNLQVIYGYKRENFVYPEESEGVSEVRNKQGFTFIELLVALAVLAVISGFSMMLVGPALKARQVEMAVRTVSLQMSRARQFSVDSRRLTRVTFLSPRTITVEQRTPASEGGIWTWVTQADLPAEMEFGVNAAVSSGPEGFGTSSAVDFSSASQVFFSPDGSAVATSGQISNGVVYVSRPQEVDTTRAVTLFGATGRIQRWRYIHEEGSWK